MSDDLDWRLLDRHLAGEASPGDEVALQHWLAADPARERMLRDLTSVVRNPKHADWDTGRAWARISARLDEPLLTLHLERRPPAPTRARAWITVGVAVVAIGALIVFVWWPQHSARQAIEAPDALTTPAPAQQARGTVPGDRAPLKEAH